MYSEKLKTLEREILTSPDKNLTIPEISELDSPAMKGLKKAITAKSINLDKYADRFGDSSYNINVQKGINEWLKMREKRENYEITDQEYIEWKLNFKLEKELY